MLLVVASDPRHERAFKGMMSPVLNATSLAVALQPLTPLRIGAVEFHNGSLTLSGAQWSLAVYGDWTWHRNDILVTGWDRPEAEDAVWDLSGVDILAAHFPDPSFDGDCSFSLSDGTLDIRSDRSGWETWTFRHGDLDLVFVGL